MADDFEQRLQVGAQIGDCLFWRNTVANRPQARAEQGGGAPDTVLYNYVGDVNNLGHAYSIARCESLAVESGYRSSCEGSRCWPSGLRLCSSVGEFAVGE